MGLWRLVVLLVNFAHFKGHQCCRFLLRLSQIIGIPLQLADHTLALTHLRRHVQRMGHPTAGEFYKPALLAMTHKGLVCVHTGCHLIKTKVEIIWGSQSDP